MPPLPDRNYSAEIDGLDGLDSLDSNSIAADIGDDGSGNAVAEVDPPPPDDPDPTPLPLPPVGEGPDGPVVTGGSRGPASAASGEPASRRVRSAAAMSGAEAAAALDCEGEGFADAACAQMRRQLANAQRREIDASAEQPMYRGVAAWVRASLRDPARPAEAQAGGGPVVTGSVLATRIMRARLTGTGFDISPKDWQEQETSLNREADWEWSVTPRIEGRRTLQVTVEPVVRAADGSEVKGDHYGKAVPVTVVVRTGDKLLEQGGLWEKLGKQWAAALGALAALAAAAWALWRTIRGKPAPAAGDGGPAGKAK
jgi:hypothetical protein